MIILFYIQKVWLFLGHNVYVTSAFKCVRLQVNNIGFEMPICVTYAFKCVHLQVINTGFEMPTVIVRLFQYMSFI